MLQREFVHRGLYLMSYPSLTPSQRQIVTSLSSPRKLRDPSEVLRLCCNGGWRLQWGLETGSHALCPVMDVDLTCRRTPRCIWRPGSALPISACQPAGVGGQVLVGKALWEPVLYAIPPSPPKLSYSLSPSLPEFPILLDILVGPFLLLA